MVRINLCILLFLASSLVNGGDKPVSDKDELFVLSTRYYPLTIGNEYYYKGFKAKAPNRELLVKAELKNVQVVDDEDYFYLFSRSEKIRYLVRRDKAGVYMRILKRETSDRRPVCGHSAPFRADFA